MTTNPVAIHLKDYRPSPHMISHVDLLVSLHPTTTRIRATHSIVPREKAPLVLNGQGLELISLSINGEALQLDEYTYNNDLLTIASVPAQPFTLQITQNCNPTANTALSGLYLSNNVYCTQMEAEGFRRFAFMLDRPDVMATYFVRIEAPRNFPVLLSNGSPVRSGLIDGTNNHFAEWSDPHPKPSYLFALVAGDLGSVQSEFVTLSGRTVKLGIYVEKGKEDRCAWAMTSLKAALLWDEQSFGREYDLDVFNIVAVSDFNMGAMENKGLNIFNDKYILARPDTATDADHVNIERIIAHEYFHNWTGNRITCRDWFQLCLKEGLTVFRDQEFTSDLRSRAVKRIEDVRTLRARQFPEDQGPLAHAVRPSSYIEINNFYTATIYEKGAELCRMMKTLVGPDAFRKAMDAYFERHDGQAATVENFVTCIADASQRDFSQFFRWYEQPGTPIVTVKSRHIADEQIFEVSVTQSMPDNKLKAPLHFPLLLGLIFPDGTEARLQPEGQEELQRSVIEITNEQQTFRFRNVGQRPVLSINRAFSAPVILNTDATEDDMLFLMAHDTDAFNRWESAQTLARRYLLRATTAVSDGTAMPDLLPYADALRSVLSHRSLDNAFKALMLELPSEQEVAAIIGKEVNSDHIHAARTLLRAALGKHVLPELELVIQITTEVGSYTATAEDVGKRSLRNAALSLFTAADPESGLAIARRELARPQNMTAEIGALLAVTALPAATLLLDDFLLRHHTDHLLVDKWFALHAQRTIADAAQNIEHLTQHNLFHWTTPNRVYAVIGTFTANQSGFHSEDGEGYRVVADAIIKLSSLNPQVAARMATGFRSWRQFDAPRQAHASKHLNRILATPGLSRDVYEIISRTLA